MRISGNSVKRPPDSLRETADYAIDVCCSLKSKESQIDKIISSLRAIKRSRCNDAMFIGVEYKLGVEGVVPCSEAGKFFDATWGKD